MINNKTKMSTKIDFNKTKTKLEKNKIKIVTLYTYNSKIIFLECKFITSGLTFIITIDKILSCTVHNSTIRTRDIKHIQEVVQVDDNNKELNFLQNLKSNINFDFVIFHYKKFYFCSENKIYLYSFEEKSKYRDQILSDSELEAKNIKLLKNDIKNLYESLLEKDKPKGILSSLTFIFQNDKGEQVSENEFFADIRPKNFKAEKTFFDPFFNQTDKIICNDVISCSANDNNKEIFIGEPYQVLKLTTILGKNKPQEKDLVENYYLLRNFEKDFFNSTYNCINEKIASIIDNIKDFINTKNGKINSLQETINDLNKERNRLEFFHTHNETVPIIVQLDKIIHKNKQEIFAIKNEVYIKMNDLDILLKSFF